MKSLKLNSRKSFLLLLTAGIFLEALYIFFFLNNGSGDIGLYMFIYFETFIIFFLGYYIIKHTEPEAGKIGSLLLKISPGNRSGQTAFTLPIIIILFGILFRVTLIPTVPTTSPDVYRYIWEGKVISNGYNPYEYSPDAVQLTELRDDLYSKVTFKNLPTIYPPAAQIIFLASYTLTGNSLTGLKLIYLLCEILTMIFLLKLLTLKGKNPNLVLLYAWLPLPVMEYFVNAHIDAAGIMFFIMFLYFLEKGKMLPSVFAFTLAFLTKLYPVFLIPLLVKKLRARSFLYFVMIFIFISVLFYYPFFNGSQSVTKMLSIYANKWEFNASIYYLLTAALADGETARLICGILLFISIGYIASYYKDFIKGVFGVLLAVIILSPVVYPWYLGWISAVNPFAGFYSVLSLLFTVNLSNFTPLGKVWHEYFPVIFTEYAVFFILLAYDLYHKKTGKTFRDLLK